MASDHELLTAISLLQPVTGRFQHIRSKQGITGVVDYAHTPDALENVASTLTQLIGKGERLFIVVGCGGNRDAGKRPEMARISVRYAHRSVFTSDNPRDEDPKAILDDMEAGLEMEERSRVLRVEDRKEAIRTACMLAEAGDVVLIAGKGHETYQEIKGERIAFDDMAVLKDTFKTLEA
jgi:UDP-N-acetylmuramoyl-L-alanyl-D-glutamate--2,6-diaminopimelate ligase